MKVVVAMDSLKGSLTSMEAGEAIREGILRVDQKVEVDIRPMADGGEGTVDALVEGMGGEYQQVFVTGPMGGTVPAVYGMIPKTKMAVIEMAQAAGITLVPPEKKNPLEATTYGVGEMIMDAIKKGCRRFIIGIGGSATNDGGVGMLNALGYEFLDGEGRPVPLGAKGLKNLAQIRDTYVSEVVRECEFRIACDVTNPLCGPQGCSAVYGPQKGADDKMIEEMDHWLEGYARLAKQKNPKTDPEYPGTGAAGGLGFAFLTFLHGRLEPGVQIVLEETGLEETVKSADLVVTGEGRLDGQTAMGKTPVGVAKLAKKYKKPVIAFAGSVSRDAVLCNENGIDAYFPILREMTSLEEAMQRENAEKNMSDTVEQVFRLLFRVFDDKNGIYSTKK